MVLVERSKHPQFLSICNPFKYDRINSDELMRSVSGFGFRVSGCFWGQMDAFLTRNAKPETRNQPNKPSGLIWLYLILFPKELAWQIAI